MALDGVTQTGSFSSIGISRNLPVINGSVRVPPDLEAYRNSLSLSSVLAVPGTSLIRLNGSGGAKTAGGKHGTQEIVQLPSVSVSGADATNNTINNLVPEVSH